MQRWIYSLCLLCFILILGGCTVEETTPHQDIVVLWHGFGGSEGHALQTLTDQFNTQNTDSIILITEYQRDIEAKLLSTTPENRPDIIVVWPDDVQTYTQEGLTPNMALLPPELVEEQDDILPMAVSLYTLNGRLQALPIGLATYLVYYNADWLGDLGYDATTANWDITQRAACAATNPQRGQVGLGMSGQAGIFLAWLTAGGANIYGSDGYYHFADEAGIQTAQQLHNIMSTGCSRVYERPSDSITQLSNSSMAMLIESSLLRLEIERSVTAARNFVLGVTIPPAIEGQGHTLWYGPALLALESTPERQAAALDVMAWFLSPEAQQQWNTDTDYLPVRQTLIRQQLETNLSPVEGTVLRLALDTAAQGTWVSWPRGVNIPMCRAALVRSLLSLSKSDVLPESALQQAVNACNTEVTP